MVVRLNLTVTEVLRVIEKDNLRFSLAWRILSSGGFIENNIKQFKMNAENSDAGWDGCFTLSATVLLIQENNAIKKI